MIGNNKPAFGRDRATQRITQPNPVEIRHELFGNASSRVQTKILAVRLDEII